MAYVSIYTLGRLQHPYHHPISREFYEMGYKVMRQAYLSGHLIKEFSPNNAPFPKEAKGEGYPVQTLTVWSSLQSLYRYTYSGKHIQAMRNRMKWMITSHEKHPPYVVWWTEKVQDVSWEEAFKRFRSYIEQGSTPYAFTFKQAYDENGQPVELK